MMGEPSGLDTDPLRTSAGLLEALRDPANREAFAKLVHRYGCLIQSWCQKRGLQAADAEDVSQEVMLKLSVKLISFVYDPQKGRFRDWLYRLTYNACMDFFRSDPSGRCVPLLVDIQAQSALESCLLDQSRYEVLQAAIAQVKPCVSQRDWSIFEQRIFRQRAAADLARELGMSVAAIHKVTSRIRERLKKQVEEFGGEQEVAA